MPQLSANRQSKLIEYYTQGHNQHIIINFIINLPRALYS